MLKPNAALKSVGTLGSGNWLETTATTVRQSATGGLLFSSQWLSQLPLLACCASSVMPGIINKSGSVTIGE